MNTIIAAVSSKTTIGVPLVFLVGAVMVVQAKFTRAGNGLSAGLGAAFGYLVATTAQPLLHQVGRLLSGA